MSSLTASFFNIEVWRGVIWSFKDCLRWTEMDIFTVSWSGVFIGVLMDGFEDTGLGLSCFLCFGDRHGGRAYLLLNGTLACFFLLLFPFLYHVQYLCLRWGKITTTDGWTTVNENDRGRENKNLLLFVCMY